MLLLLKSSSVRVEFCCKDPANAWQETHDLRNAMKPKANIGKHHIVVLLLSKITVLGSKTHQMNQPKPMAHHCMIRCLASLSFILHNFRLITKLLSLKGSQKVNYSKKTISNSLRFARLTWYIWDSTLRYIAFRHFPDVSFIRPCLDLSFLHCFTALLHSWHHRHQTDQTPSLWPFISDVVEPQMQPRQGGVLFQGLGQSLAGDTWLEKHEWSTQTCKILTIAFLIYSKKLYSIHAGKLTLPGQLTAWLKKSPHYIYNFYQELFWGNPSTWFLMILNMSGRTNS